MSEALIPDQQVDTLQIVWEETPQYSGPRVVDTPPELRMIRDFLSTRFWQNFVRFIAPGVLNHHGRVNEYSGFTFQSDLDPDDDPFEGVEMFDPIDTIHISEAAFDRLMSRYFNTIVEGAAAHQKPETQEEWWQDFVENARELYARAYSE